MNTHEFDATAAKDLAEIVIRAFDEGDVTALTRIVHPGQNERGRKNSEEWERSLMDAGFKVVDWRASPWKQPEWQVFDYLRFHPEPIGMIEMELQDPQGDQSGFFIACAPLDGQYLQCYYVDK